MNFFKPLFFTLCASSGLSAVAADFSFDRPGTGFGTGITPVGQLAWEQGLPAATYSEQATAQGKIKSLALNADALFRTGLTPSMELQLGWQGPSWSKTKSRGHSEEESGLGDVSIGIKKLIDLQDDRLTWAVLAQAQIATGNEGFSAEEDIYTLGSTLDFQYNDDLNTSLTMFYEVQDGDWSVTAVPTLSYKIAGNWSGFSEFVYSKKESSDYEYRLGTGLMYAVNERTQLDASIGVELSDPNRAYSAGLGLAYLF